MLLNFLKGPGAKEEVHDFFIFGLGTPNLAKAEPWDAQ